MNGTCVSARFDVYPAKRYICFHCRYKHEMVVLTFLFEKMPLFRCWKEFLASQLQSLDSS